MNYQKLAGFLIWQFGGLGKKVANINHCDSDSLAAGLNRQIKKLGVLEEIAKFNARQISHYSAYSKYAELTEGVNSAR